MVILLSALLILVTCKQCSVNDVQNQLEIEACRSNVNDSSNAFDANVGSEMESRHVVEHHNIENICPVPNSFCFTSTLTGSLANGIDAKDASAVQSEGFSSGLSQLSSNLSQPPHHAIFKLLGGRTISCSFSMLDGYAEFPSSDRSTESNKKIDVSSCRSLLINKKPHHSISVDNTVIAKPGFSDGLSIPPVELKPTLLDWGNKHILHPSLAFLMLKNIHADSILSIYDLYSSNSQFYPCSLSEILLAPGEIVSLCFVFYPLHLGLSQAQLVLQTSFGGFLIQAKGYAIESPYLVKPLSGLDLCSSGRWRQNLSLFNPFDEALYVNEVTAWISTSSGNASSSSTSICHIHSLEDSGDYSVLSAKDWLAVERDRLGRPIVTMRPHNNWEVDPQKTLTVMELDISDHFQGRVDAVFCVKLLQSSNGEADTVMIPFEAELSRNTASYTGHVSLSLEALVPCNTSGLVAVALSIRNDAPYMLRFIKVTEEVGEGTENFQIKSVGGLVLFPNTTTQVAILNHARIRTHEVSMGCKLHVTINDTRNSVIEIPCNDVISICPGRQLESSVGKVDGACNVDYISGGERIFSGGMQPSSGIKVVDAREADELVLRNWKSLATASFMSVLYETELLFPMVFVGNYSSQWIAVRNPSEEPVVMQIILNSGEVIDKCEIPEELFQLSSPKIFVGEKSIAPTSYGFSIANGAVTEALIQPYASATLGPILFQPSNRCEWRSSVLIRNNLSGVEWLSLRGFGGSIALVLLEDHDPIESLEFKVNMSTWLNFSSPDSLQPLGGNSHSCHQPLTKEVYAKNMGDLPLEVKKLEVSGTECGLDGFTVHDCKGFSLLPGESTRLFISYQSDFTVATIYRDLELVLASGVVVVPMKASIPLCFLNFCKRSIFWIRLKKAILVILFSASLLVFLLFANAPAFTSQKVKDGKNPSAVARSWSSLYGRFNLKNNGEDVFLKSDTREALLLKSVNISSNDVTSPQGFVRQPAETQRKTSLVDIEPETNLIPSTLSRPSSAENFGMQDTSDSRNLRVRVGNEKGRRRKKKKNSGLGVLPFDVSSSHSSNSTPSSPSSPAASGTPRRPPPVSPPMLLQPVEPRNPFSEAPLKKIDKTKCSKGSPKDIVLNKELRLGRGSNNCGAYAKENPSLTGKLVARPVLSSSATFPSAGRAAPQLDRRSPYLALTSAIDLHSRAPGSGLHNRKTTGVVEENMPPEQKYNYDIWGDHLFGLSLTFPSNTVSGISLPTNENCSESFFVRGPQALMKNSMLQPANPNLEGGNE